MIEELNDYLKGIAIGIRFRANFSIEDQLGSMVDEILYTANAFFSPKLFPKVYHSPNEKKLINEDTNDSLIINLTNIILEIKNDELLAPKEKQKMNICFEKEIIDGIMKKYKVTQIGRIGYVNRYIFKNDNLAKNLLDKIIGSTLDGINDINLKFTKKYPVPTSLTTKDISDYNNVIYDIVKKADKDELFISVDYQKHFKPFLGSSDEIEFSKFIDKVEDYNSNTFLNWLNNNFG